MALRREELTALGSPDWPARLLVPLRVDEIPIKKGLLDLVAFRSVDKVRQRLFGASNRPDKKIAPSAKLSRLGEAGKHYMRERVTQFRNDLQRGAAAATIQRLSHDLREATVSALSKALQARQPDLRTEMLRCKQHQKRLQQVLEPLTKLNAAGGDVVDNLQTLSSQYEGADVELRAQPLANTDGSDVVLEPEPRDTAKQADQRPKPRERQLD